MIRGCAHNPFSTEKLGPEGLGYVFPEGHGLSHIMRAITEHHYRCEIVGRHGTGKSTLLHTLGRTMESSGLKLVRLRCSDQRRSLGIVWPVRMLFGNVVLLDGAEQCRRVELRLLRLWCFLWGKGLILTTHQSTGHGFRYDALSTPELLSRVVREIDGSRSHGRWADDLHARHSGDVRSALFELYDEHEQADC